MVISCNGVAQSHFKIDDKKLTLTLKNVLLVLLNETRLESSTHAVTPCL